MHTAYSAPIVLNRYDKKWVYLLSGVFLTIIGLDLFLDLFNKSTSHSINFYFPSLWILVIASEFFSKKYIVTNAEIIFKGLSKATIIPICMISKIEDSPKSLYVYWTNNKGFEDGAKIGAHVKNQFIEKLSSIRPELFT